MRRGVQWRIIKTQKQTYLSNILLVFGETLEKCQKHRNSLSLEFLQTTNLPNIRQTRRTRKRATTKFVIQFPINLNYVTSALTRKYLSSPLSLSDCQQILIISHNSRNFCLKNRPSCISDSEKTISSVPEEKVVRRVRIDIIGTAQGRKKKTRRRRSGDRRAVSRLADQMDQ